MRRSRRNRNNKTKILLVVIAILFTCMGIGYSYLVQEVSIDGTANVLPYLNYIQNEWPYEDRTVYEIRDFVVTNGQPVTSYGWEAIFNVPSDSQIVHCWLSQCRIEGSKLIATSDSNTAMIPPGEAIKFSFQFSTHASSYVLNMESLNIYTEERPSETEITITEGINATVSKQGPWNNGNGYTSQYSANIVNTTDKDLFYWEIHFGISSNNITVTNNWNCDYVLKENELVVSGVSHNIVLNSGVSTQMGFSIQSSDENFVLTTNYALGKSVVE